MDSANDPWTSYRLSDRPSVMETAATSTATLRPQIVGPIWAFPSTGPREHGALARMREAGGAPELLVLPRTVETYMVVSINWGSSLWGSL